MIEYILEFALIHLLFLLVYKVLLSGETQLSFRRFFLIGATLLSLIIPLMDIPVSDPISGSPYFANTRIFTQTISPSPD